ncbi:caspase family protein, partial [Flavobacteriaceae bacterium]|nr:caspase family protein [Flavobacteriaceae bacterium]
MVVFKRIIFCFAFLTAFFSFSQGERRLALVIGNSNYEKGELNNPVNDAKLIARTLDSLNFDVIEAYDIETQRGLIDIIKEFRIKRDSADIGFVYYAGHGVQINNENFLLPTKEVYNSESDVEDYAVSVQKIMRVLESKADQVNILILDACRDNPFESSWQKTRSIEGKGQGLAKLPPPTGSLIAFSTDSGKTAPDGEGENSIYTMSLSKNMLLEQTSIDQVFRNVRAEVLSESNGEQRPIEATQLTGKAFYLNPSDYKKIYKEVESILGQEDGDLLYTLSLIEPVIKNTNELEANLLKARIYNGLKEYEKSETEFSNLILLDSLNPEVYVRYAQLLVDKEDFKKSIEYYSKAITIDYTKVSYYLERAIPYEILGMYDKAEDDYLKAIDIEPRLELAYNSLAELYGDQLNEPEKAIAQFLKALEINPVSSLALNSIGVTYAKNLKNNKKAEEYYLMASEVDSLNPYPLYNLANFYHNQKLYQKSIEYYSRAIAI